MKVKTWMTKKLVTVTPDTSVKDILSLMSRKLIRHIPVLEGSRVVGLVTDGEIRNHILDFDNLSVAAKEVMILNPITITPSASIDSAATLISRYNIGSLLVLYRRQLVGILTRKDILTAFMERFGLFRSGFSLDILLENRSDSFTEVISTISRLGGRVVGVGVETKPSRRKVYQIRLDKGDWREIISALEDRGHKVISLLEDDEI